MLSDTVKQEIQKAYSQFLESKGWQARQGQKTMIAEIARSLGNIEVDAEGKRVGTTNHLCVVEAGTGTGKTVAYCLAAIPLAKALDKTLVISTATVALQEQIVYKDLPDISRQAGLKFEFALAKGRARYLCPAKLDTQLEGVNLDPTQGLYPDEIPAVNTEATNLLFQEMATNMASGEWAGDRDDWPKHIDNADWFKVTTDHRQCAGRRCAYIAQCPFFKARDHMQGVDVVVVNHDLVLADLALGGGAILPAPEECIYIFDEGHHLADKAIAHFSCHTRVDGSKKFLKQSEKTIAAMAKALGASVGSVGAQLQKVAEVSRELQSALTQLFSYLEENIDFANDENNARGQKERAKPRQRHPAYQQTRRYRFPHGIIPAELQQQAATLSQLCLQLNGLLLEIADQLKQALDGYSEIPKHVLEQWYPAVGLMQARAESQADLWSSYARPDSGKNPPLARWISLRDDAQSASMDFEVCSSPIQSASDLEQTLWRRCFAAVITSATLTALNSFDRFQARSGVAATAHYLSIRSPFNFEQAIFSVPPLSVEPSDNQGHTDAIIDFMKKDLNREIGNLVLFSSRRQMDEVFSALDSDHRQMILLQGDLSKQEMISEHKKRIDAGKGSTLFGLASFSEGVDLPGVYCEHVVIAKLPFATPDDPVEEAMAEWVEQQGGNAFMQISVPDAAMKLVQACGRLLRNEKDSGRITLLDKRVVTKRYGKMILDSLPPYKIQIDN